MFVLICVYFDISSWSCCSEPKQILVELWDTLRGGNVDRKTHKRSPIRNISSFLLWLAHWPLHFSVTGFAIRLSSSSLTEENQHCRSDNDTKIQNRFLNIVRHWSKNKSHGRERTVCCFFSAVAVPPSLYSKRAALKGSTSTSYTILCLQLLDCNKNLWPVENILPQVFTASFGVTLIHSLWDCFQAQQQWLQALFVFLFTMSVHPSVSGDCLSDCLTYHHTISCVLWLYVSGKQYNVLQILFWQFRTHSLLRNRSRKYLVWNLGIDTYLGCWP